MGEIVDFPRPRKKPEGDISDTPLGQAIIEGNAKPVFQAAIDKASEYMPGLTVDMENGDWTVVPLGESPKDAS